MLESCECRLLLPTRGDQPGLPACEGGLVLQQEPEHHVDSRVLAGDRECLRQVCGLLRVGDADERVGWVRLVAVLGDPEALVAVELRQQCGQVAQEREWRYRGAAA